MGTVIVITGDGFETLLASGIPLFISRFGVGHIFHSRKWTSFSDKNTKSTPIVLKKLVVKVLSLLINHISHKHTRFTNPAIADDQDFEREVAN